MRRVYAAAIGAFALSATGSCGATGNGDNSLRLGDLAAQAAAEQKQAFTDDRITFAEYEQAVDRTVSCIIDHGFGAEKQRNPDGMFVIVLSGASSSDESDREYDRCSDRFKTQIEVGYARGHQSVPTTRPSSTTHPGS